MDKKKSILKLQLNSINDVSDDPTIKKCTFSIVDFDESGNGQVITKELAQKYSYTLKNKPLLCQYFPTTDYENQNDHFGDHGEYVGKDRYGNDTLKTNTIAIGCTDGQAYISTIKDELGTDIEALCCDFVLWYSRYTDIVDLIKEMVDEGLDLYSSCEYWFSNYTVSDGIQYINEPIYFDGHCVLQSGENGTDKIAPAYKTSKLQSFNKVLEKVINNKQGGDYMSEKMFKKICQLSFSQIESLIYTALQGVLSENEYDASWITESYDDHVILSYRSGWDSGYDRKYYSVNYTKGENDLITLDWEGRKEVFLYKEWREIPEVQQALNKLQNDLELKEESIKSLNSNLEDLKTENKKTKESLNDADEKIVSLNSQVEDMTPIVEKYNNEKLEKSINEAKEKYKDKFKKVGAMEKFETEEVQELITKSINNESVVSQLNSMIVDMIDDLKTKEKPVVEMIQSTNNLLHKEYSFEDAYGFEIE